MLDSTASLPSLLMLTQATRTSPLNQNYLFLQIHTSLLVQLFMFSPANTPEPFCRTRAGISRADQYYASYPAGTELLTDTAKVWKLNIRFYKYMWRSFFYCQWYADLNLLFFLFPVPTLFGGLQLYKAALGNCFEIDEWGPIEFSIMAKHFDRQGKPPYAYHAVRTYTRLSIIRC